MLEVLHRILNFTDEDICLCINHWLHTNLFWFWPTLWVLLLVWFGKIAMKWCLLNTHLDTNQFLHQIIRQLNVVQHKLLKKPKAFNTYKVSAKCIQAQYQLRTVCNRFHLQFWIGYICLSFNTRVNTSSFRDNFPINKTRLWWLGDSKIWKESIFDKSTYL